MVKVFVQTSTCMTARSSGFFPIKKAQLQPATIDPTLDLCAPGIHYRMAGVKHCGMQSLPTLLWVYDNITTIWYELHPVLHKQIILYTSYMHDIACVCVTCWKHETLSFEDTIFYSKHC